MKRHLLIVYMMFLAVVGCDAEHTFSSTVASNGLVIQQNENDFKFVVVGDRTGGHRPDVFTRAMTQINLLGPDFVVSVGDLIEGYSENPDVINQQWDEIESIIDNLKLPFFYTAGNHDISNPNMTNIWKERRGPSYYHFIYKNVLFVVLNTEDPAIALSQEYINKTIALENAMRDDPVATQNSILARSKALSSAVKLPGSIAMSSEQVQWVEQVLERNSAVRWTFVLMHKPAWQYGQNGFDKIEEALQGRPYTVIAGHEHYYQYERRLEQDYVVMATTGGVWLRDGPGRLDHVAQVSMTSQGPRFLNISTNGMHDISVIKSDNQTSDN